MKILYTILFFTDTVLLALLSFDLFKMIDEGAGNRAIIIVIVSIAVCIAFLVFFLLQYIRQPHSGKER